MGAIFIQLSLLVKLAGSIVWIFVGFAVSREINNYENKKLTQTDAFITLINHIKLNIDCYALPVPSILQSCDRGLICDCGGENAPMSGISEFINGCDICLDANIYAVLTSFADSLGKGYRESEIRLCDLCISELSAYKNGLLEKLGKSKKLCTTICLCIFCAVLLIIV